MSGRKGFTLVELLVVIAIITILLSIVIPALRKAKEQAKLTICMYHERQIITAVQAYSISNNGNYPEHVAVCKRTPNSSGLWWDSPEMMPQNQSSSNPSSTILDGGYEDGHVERYTSLETCRQASRGRYFLLPKWN